MPQDSAYSDEYPLGAFKDFINERSLGQMMLLRRIGLFSSISTACILGSGCLLSSSVARDISFKASSTPLKYTIGLAPLSLGNPLAAIGPQTSLPMTPISSNLNLTDPTFKYRTKWTEKKLSFRTGDTLDTLLTRAGVNQKEAHQAVKAFSKTFDPRLIQGGQKLWVRHQITIQDIVSDNPKSGTFAGFRYKPSLSQEIHVLREKNNSYKATFVDHKLVRHITRSEGIIQSSLYLAGRKARLQPATLAELIRAFSWDVDFQRDIRKGDKFEVMFNTALNADGKVVRSDEILFAALTLRGKRKAIYRLDDINGAFEYFDEKGHSAQKALMRTPIDGARLSSGYGRRRHPILGYTKMHRGVDFAAPRGTPIYAAGNGIIEVARRNGAYGKYIRIRHNGTYKTAYAHMSRYGRNIKRGVRVRQGQIIGYVGSTGRSTGNHLHFEVIRNGKKQNPMRIKMPSGRKLVGQMLSHFHATRMKLDARYHSIPTGTPIQVSSADW